MSFTSLLSQIKKEKIPPQSLSSNLNSISKQISKPNSSTTVNKGKNVSKPAKSTLSPPKSTLNRTSQPTMSYTDDDPAVRRLKEARRLEREKLQKLKGTTSNNSLKSPSKSTSKAKIKNKTTNLLSTERKQNNSKTIPSPPTKSRFKTNPFLKQSRDKDQNINNKKQSTTNLSTTPKLSFKELMKQASSMDHIPDNVLSFKPIKKESTKEPSKAFKSLQKSRARESMELRQRNNVQKFPRNTDKSEKLQISPRKQGYQSQNQSQNRPQMFAKPNTALLNKLKERQKQPKKSFISKTKRFNQNAKKKDDIDVGDSYDEYEDEGYGYRYEDDDYDSQDDGFIVDDDDDDNDGHANNMERRLEREYDQMKSQGYSKNEIWEIFNRGRKRNYYDRDEYDSDDMEATGTEILEDEERTLKQAKLDDLKEQRLLEKKAAEKRKLLRR